MLVILSSCRSYDFSGSKGPPSLDVYLLKGEVPQLRSFLLPDFALGNLLQEIRSNAAQVNVSGMDIQFSPVVAIYGEQPPPFVPDPGCRFCNIQMKVEFAGTELFNFIIPLQSITDRLPKDSVDPQDPLLCSEDLRWDYWTRSGVGLATWGWRNRQAESLASQLLWGNTIGLQGGCQFTYQDDGTKQEFTSYDYTSHAVRRERLGLNRPHPEVEVKILEPDPHDLKRMKLFFGHTNNVVLPCVRRRRIYTNLPRRIRAAMDEEHIILFTSVCCILLGKLIISDRERFSQLEPTDTDPLYRCNMEIWSM
jgi:hypothetical protein